MTSVCPAGHQSTADDYCDVCGVPIDLAAQPAPAAPATPAVPGAQPCPGCGTPNGPDALFCESCGYDFTTGTMPRPLDPPDPVDAPTPPAAAPAAPTSTDPGGLGLVAPADEDDVPAPAPPRWVVEVWIDPDWYAAQQSSDPMPSPGLPEVIVLTSRSALVGRVSKSRNIHPDVDCDTDSGVSRRQAQLTTDGTRWWVEDLESANGTFVGPASGPLPADPLPVGVKRELNADDRIYLGAWTRIVLRPADEGE